MSNFICPTCGLKNIDCEKAGYKTDREIELEEKLDIAVKALEFISIRSSSYNVIGQKAEEALEKIKENK